MHRNADLNDLYDLHDLNDFHDTRVIVIFDILDPCWVLEKSEEPCRILKKFVHACVVNAEFIFVKFGAIQPIHIHN